MHATTYSVRFVSTTETRAAHYLVRDMASTRPSRRVGSPLTGDRRSAVNEAFPIIGIMGQTLLYSGKMGDTSLFTAVSLNAQP